jgi:hypothetical protein
MKKIFFYTVFIASLLIQSIVYCAAPAPVGIPADALSYVRQYLDVAVRSDFYTNRAHDYRVNSHFGRDEQNLCDLKKSLGDMHSCLCNAISCDQATITVGPMFDTMVERFDITPRDLVSRIATYLDNYADIKKQPFSVEKAQDLFFAMFQEIVCTKLTVVEGSCPQQMIHLLTPKLYCLSSIPILACDEGDFYRHVDNKAGKKGLAIICMFEAKRFAEAIIKAL